MFLRCQLEKLMVLGIKEVLHLQPNPPERNMNRDDIVNTHYYVM